jgi:hypothetical protein
MKASSEDKLIELQDIWIDLLLAKVKEDKLDKDDKAAILALFKQNNIQVEAKPGTPMGILRELPFKKEA